MKTINGDIIKLSEQGYFDVLVHGCNCFHTMGAGLAKQIKQRYPQSYHVDLLHTKRGDREKLGKFSVVEVKSKINELHTFYIINAYTQYEYGKKGNYADYTAIKKVFQKIKNDYGTLRIAYPKIGAGLAGGDWKKISKIINNTLNECNHTLVLWE